MSNIKTVVRKYLLNGVAKQSGVEAIEAELNEARGGMYACTVQAAAAAGDKAVFFEVCETLMNDFRANKRGIAVKHNMATAKDKQGNPATDSDGNAIYKVPSSLSTAKSVLGKAFDNGIDVGTVDNPESFGAIRTANKVAKDEKATTESVEALTGDAKRRHETRELLLSIADSLDGYSGKALTAIIKLIKAIAKDTPVAAEKVA